MLISVLVSISVSALLVIAWYGVFLHLNRRRASRVLRWVEGAFAAHGQIGEVEWLNPSHFRARLRLSGSAFRQPSLDARMAPREMPLRWALWRWRRRQETLTFEANLSCPPRYSMEIGRTRHAGLTRRWMRIDGDWPTAPVASLFISTQPEWEPEISNRMSAVLAARELDVLGIAFRPRAPHFSVTLSLSDSLKNPGGELTVFASLRELAQGSPTSRL
jgi:hypothetical protein